MPAAVDNIEQCYWCKTGFCIANMPGHPRAMLTVPYDNRVVGD